MTWSIGRYGDRKITVIAVIRSCQGRKKMWYFVTAQCNNTSRLSP
jgi:hypothetical protein